MKLTQTEELGALLAVLKVRLWLVSPLPKAPAQGPLCQPGAGCRVLCCKRGEYNVPVQTCLRTGKNKPCFSKCIKVENFISVP